MAKAKPKCQVCGYTEDADICPCCGSIPSLRESVEDERAAWVGSGMLWYGRRDGINVPEGWDARKQLASIL